MLGALFGFSGRLSRPGYWEVWLSIVLIDIALVIGRMYVADSGLPGGLGPSHPLCQALLGAAPWVLVIFTVWSGVAAAVKRCHDRDRPGALVLVGLIPVIGWLWLLIDLFFLEGTEGRNRYGRPPHGPEERSRFDWSAEPEAAPAHEPQYRMMDPEPVFEHPAPSAEVYAPEAPPEPALEEESHAAALEPALDPAPHPDPEPMPELVQESGADHGHDHDRYAAPAAEAYDPLNAPLVLNIR